MEAPGSKSETADAARLVISIDVGTTQSAVALAYLPSGILQRFTLRAPLQAVQLAYPALSIQANHL